MTWALFGVVAFGFCALILGEGSDGQDAYRRRALAETSHEHAREALLAQWHAGKRSGRALEYAEGEGYVTGEGIDNAWVKGLMSSDRRLRAHNRKRPCRGVLRVSRD